MLMVQCPRHTAGHNNRKNTAMPWLTTPLVGLPFISLMLLWLAPRFSSVFDFFYFVLYCISHSIFYASALAQIVFVEYIYILLSSL